MGVKKGFFLTVAAGVILYILCLKSFCVRETWNTIRIDRDEIDRGSLQLRIISIEGYDRSDGKPYNVTLEVNAKSPIQEHGSNGSQKQSFEKSRSLSYTELHPDMETTSTDNTMKHNNKPSSDWSPHNIDNLERREHQPEIDQGVVPPIGSVPSASKSAHTSTPYASTLVTPDMKSLGVEVPEEHSPFRPYIAMEGGQVKIEAATRSTDAVIHSMPRSELRELDKEVPERRFAARRYQYIGNKYQPTNLSNRSMHDRRTITFPKRPLLSSRISCTVDRIYTASHPHVRSEVDVIERKIVEQNLLKCLAAAELTDYFESRNFTPISLRNADQLLLMMRTVVPANYSAHHSNSSCWKSPFDVTVCVGGNVEGHLNKIPFTVSGYSLSPELQQLLYRPISSPVLCLPSIFIAGFPKCGSSFVYCLIRTLYKLDVGKGMWTQLEKEPHFWVPRGPHDHHLRPPNYADIATYLINYVPRWDGTTSLPIDGSPNLLFQWAKYSGRETVENYCLVPSVLPVILPQNKYIVVLRNPVTMLYSAFWFSTSTHCRSLNRTQQRMAPDIFHDKVVKKINLYKSCISHRPVDACLDILFSPLMSSIRDIRCNRVRLEVGFYYYYIRRWLAVIPREQFFFVTIEELSDGLHSNTTSATLQQLVNFLGFNVPLSVIQHYLSVGKHCVNTQLYYNYRRDSALQMRSDTKQLLSEFFDPINQKLAELLQDPKYLWKP